MNQTSRSSSARRLGVGLALLAALALTPAAPAAAKTKTAPNPLFWGAQIGTQFTGEQAPWDMNAVSKFETVTGKAPSIVSFSSPFAECDGDNCVLNNFPTTPLEDVREHGSIPFFSWNSGSNGPPYNPTYTLSKIIDGSFDSHIRAFAERSKEWGHPYFLRFDWEMNGFWFPWSENVNGNRPGEFVAAWRHVHDLFSAEHATNATWVWCPNIDFNRKLIPLHSLYPGAKYVDWTCLDGFNWGDTLNSAGWQNFNQVFHSTYARVLKIAPHKPVAIGEVASDDRGGSKAAWIKNMLRIIPSKYRRIRAVIWYDELDQGMHWPIESQKSAASAFAKSIARPVFMPNAYSNFESDGPIQPPPW
jgi:beta-mannanase